MMAAPSFYKRLTPFVRNLSIILTVTKIKCISWKYIYIEVIQIISSSGIYMTIDIITIVIYGYLLSNLVWIAEY